MKTVMLLPIVIYALIAGTAYADDDYKNNGQTPPVPITNGMETDQSKETVILNGRKQTRLLYTTTQTIDFGEFCRWKDHNIDVFFNNPSFPGYKLSSATIELSYFDADFNDQSMFSNLEVDIVGIGDSSHAVDVLKGFNNRSNTSEWSVVNQLRRSSDQLRFQVNIDALQTGSWCLEARNATLQTLWQEEYVSY
jgi:hypothetical protein